MPIVKKEQEHARVYALQKVTNQTFIAYSLPAHETEKGESMSLFFFFFFK